jgi:hypothetical protein
MSDRLKKHVTENRSSFEVYKGDYDSWWNEIEDKLNKEDGHSSKTIPWKNLLKIAASILLIMTVGIGFLWLKGNSTRYADGVSLRDLSPELAEAEIYYNQMVEDKMSLIKSSNVDLVPVVIKDFEMLDSAYNELKMDLEDNMYNEEVIDAMIQNYRIKLQILERILKDIEKSNVDNEEDEEILSI